VSLATGSANSNQGYKSSGGSTTENLQFLEGHPAKETEIATELDVVAQLSKRPEGTFEESSVLLFAKSGAAFDNVRRDRDGTSSHLRYEAIALMSGEVLRLAVCKDYETVGELEGAQLSVVSHCSIAPLIE